MLYVDRQRTFHSFQRYLQTATSVEPFCDGSFFQLRADFDISKEKLKGITDHMLSEMDAGLASAGTSSLLMIPTHLTTVPTGQETGSYLALDLGGTNFRVLKVGIT